MVPGDILLLRPGSYVAADARLLESQRLSVDESALTGESLPVAKTTTALTAAEVPLADRHNMVYAGTLVTGGQGLMQDWISDWKRWSRAERCFAVALVILSLVIPLGFMIGT